ncbi:MAG: DUF1003 domain-containing protein [Acidobacteriota bacterium]
MATEAALLAGVPFFQYLDDNERATLAEQLDEVQIPAGQVVFQVGDPGGTMYVIRTGAVEVFFRDDTGERIVLESPGPGEVFGELSFLDGGARSASVVVVEDLAALAVDRQDLDVLFRMHPQAGLDIMAAMGKRLRKSTELLRHTAARNVNVEIEDKRTMVEKAADWIAAFSGSIPFLLIHVVLFALWIVLNIDGFPWSMMFDPFPYGLLTMIVSLEAIILSVFVLLSQNRQTEKDRVRGDIEYEVNLKAELEIAHLHEKVDRLYEETTARLDALRSRPSGAVAGEARPQG